MNRALAFLALAGLAAMPRAVSAQGIPQALKNSALVVRVHAIMPKSTVDQGLSQNNQAQGTGKAEELAWQAENVKYTVPGTPVPFKLVGSNVAIVVQITPYLSDNGKSLTLIAQGQVWIKPPSGGLSYHTNIDTLSVDFGETVLFYPLGVEPEGRTPLRLEIAVFRASDMPDASGDSSSDKGGPDKAASPDKSGGGEKTGTSDKPGK